MHARIWSSFEGTTLEYLALGMDRRLGDSDAPGDGRRSQRAGERPVSDCFALSGRYDRNGY
jgi:hypothetical protein